jgi:biotin transport system substrate-specific component
MSATTATATSRPATLADVLVPARARSLVMDAILIIAGAALTAIAAQLSFRAPWTDVPYTLQTGAVLLVGTTLGLRRGALSMALYVFVGAIGLPVFAEASSGLSRLFGYTGGYLFAFILAAAVTGWLAQRGWDRSALGTLGLMAIGTLIVYATGVPVLAMSYSLPLWTAINSGAVVFLPWDILKALVAAGLFPVAWQLTGRR